MEVKSVTVPIRPTQEEVDKHCLNHAVYRNWCEFCVRGRGKEDPHRFVKKVKCRSQCCAWTTGS